MKKQIVCTMLLLTMSLTLGACSKKDTPQIIDLNEETSVSSEIPTEESDVTEESTPTSESVPRTSEAIPTEPIEMPPHENVVDDTFGSLNGYNFDVASGVSFSETFGHLGFDFEQDPETWNVAIEDSKTVLSNTYSGANVYLSRDGAYSVNDIKAQGFTGYGINVADSVNKPIMTFRGVTWGASKDDILEAYAMTEENGYTMSIFEGESVTLIDYTIGEYNVSFTVYNSDITGNGSGLQAVFVMHNEL